MTSVNTELTPEEIVRRHRSAAGKASAASPKHVTKVATRRKDGTFIGYKRRKGKR